MSNRRVCWPAPIMYSILEAGGKNTKKAKGVKKECRGKAHQARAVQRGPLRKASLPPWHLRATSEQDVSLTFGFQGLDRKKWGGHAGIWTQGCGPRGMSLGGLKSCSTPEDPIRW